MSYTWDDIQRAQRNGTLAELSIAIARDSEGDNRWTKFDEELLKAHKTEEALKAVGLYELLKRAKLHGKL